MNELEKGTLLIAEPFLKDPNFQRTVVLMCEHDEEGTFGFVLNRLYKKTLDDLFPPLEGLDLPMFYGGPVEQNSLHFLHRLPDDIPGGVEVLPGVFWSGDYEAMIRTLQADRKKSKQIRFFLGYSGWSKGQLEEEMEEKTWITLPATKKLIFDTGHAVIWQEALKTLGGEYRQMVNYPVDPRSN